MKSGKSEKSQKSPKIAENLGNLGNVEIAKNAKNPQNTAKPSITKSFAHAINGIRHAAATERNFKIHLIFAALAIIFCIIFASRLTTVDIFMIIYAIFAVLCLELVNTAIEAAVDLSANKKISPLAKIAKDCCAGAVLLAALQAVIIGVVVVLRVLLG